MVSGAYIDVAQITTESGRDVVRSVLRNKKGVRFRRDFTPIHRFYQTVEAHDPDDTERWVSVTGLPVAKVDCSSMREKKKLLSDYFGTVDMVWESDVRQDHQIIEEYLSEDVPDLHVSVFDIEVDIDPSLGFPEPSTARFPINAVSNHNKWTDESTTLVLAPDNIDIETCEKLLRGEVSQDEDGNIIDVPADDDFGDLLADAGWKLYETERELLLDMIQLWTDTDIWTGWNSESFDVPYIVQRIRQVLGDEDPDHVYSDFVDTDIELKVSEASRRFLTALCPTMDKLPTKRIVERYGRSETVLQTYGIVHVDYLNLYRKYTLGEKHSYKLDNILRDEIGETKVEYTGNLFDLYRKDFRRFVAYSYQDTRGLSRLDDKKRFIDLANRMVHMAGVTFRDVMGSVALIERALMKHYHKRGIILNDRHDVSYYGFEKEFPVPGAYVLDPIPGMVTEGGIVAYDYNSLYPSIIRTLNIDPQTIVGHLDVSETLRQIEVMMAGKMTATEAWAHFAGTLEYQAVVSRSDERVIYVDEHTKQRYEVTGRELWNLLVDEGLTITPFGLIITNEEYGVIPSVLTEWYEQRVESKKIIKRAREELHGDNEPSPERKKELESMIGVHDSIQQAMKTLLNSTYGAMANKYFRMYDPRMAASVTLAGRMLLLSMSYGLEKITLHEGRLA